LWWLYVERSKLHDWVCDVTRRLAGRLEVRLLYK
jgi:hypothetical protein